MKDSTNSLAMQINYESLEQFFRDYAINSSLGGIFILSKELLPVGTVLRILFNVPQLERPIETTGIVAHVIAESDVDGSSGMGVRFNDIDRYSKDMIDAAIANQQICPAL